MPGGAPNVWVPMPLPIVLVGFITSVLFPFVTPALYLLTLRLSSVSRHFAKIVLALVIVLSALNIMYFHSAWEYGVEYQGFEHTRIVAMQNIVGFSIAMIIAVLAIVKGSSSRAYAANFFLFMLLSWCAFPYLGELP